MMNKFILLSITAISPAVFAGDTYIETGTTGPDGAGQVLIKYTTDSGHYGKFHFEGEGNSVKSIDWTGDPRLSAKERSIEYGFNIPVIDNLTISPHAAFEFRNEMHEKDYDNKWIYFALGLDAKYSLPYNTYISVNTSIGDQVSNVWRRSAGIEIGWTEPRTNISIMAGYSTGTDISDKIGGKGLNEYNTEGPYLSIGWTF